MSSREQPVQFPFSEANGLEVDPKYSELRQQQPVIRVSVPHGHDAWLATRHADVRVVLSDPRFSRAASIDHDEPRLTPLPLRTSIMALDPPDHTRLRGIVVNAFTTRRVEQLRSWVAELTDDLLDQLADHGPPVDIVHDFAEPFTGRVICALLGLPFEDREKFGTWLEAYFSTTALPVAEIEVRMKALEDYLGEQLAVRRAQPGDDLVSSLLNACDQERKCSQEELLGLISVLLIAGHDTTAAQLATSVYVLLTHPEHADLLRQRSDLTPCAVEELLRYVPLVSHVSFARYATEDLVLGGEQIREGDAVLPAISSANRDAEAFDDPDALDFHRASNPHVGFGHGPHRCVGAALVRMEMEVAVPALLHRFPTLRLAVPEHEVGWVSGAQARALSRLPVAW